MSEGEDVFDRAFRLKAVGTGWAFIGGCFLIFGAAMAVAHYGYDAPIYRRHTRQLASEARILLAEIVFGMGGIAAIVAGLAMRRRSNRMTDEAGG